MSYQHHQSVRRKITWGVLACGLWLAGVSVGFAGLLNYSLRPSAAATVKRSPQVQGLLATDRPTLLMFLHPLCPCSRASLQELSQLLSRIPDPAKVVILFSFPAGRRDEVAASALWQQAGAIPGAQLRHDDDGILTREFGVETSGQVLLFDAQSNLVFSGGITAARGHAGANAAEDSLAAYLHDGKTPQHSSPVFGCSLVLKTLNIFGSFSWNKT